MKRFILEELIKWKESKYRKPKAVFENSGMEKSDETEISYILFAEPVQCECQTI